MYLIHDNYYKHQPHLTLDERTKCNYDHPDSLETALLVKHIRNLKAGHSVRIPEYDFSTHLRKSNSTLKEARRIVIVEGILLFSDKDLLKELDLKVFVDADSDIRLMRRMARDISERGRSSEQVCDQYSTTVRPMHLEFVEPSKRIADIVLCSSGSGDFSVAVTMITNHLKCETSIMVAAKLNE